MGRVVVPYNRLQPQMKTPIFHAPTCFVPSTDLVFPRLQPCQFEAPTSSILRHQPLGLQRDLQYKLQPGFLRTPIFQGSNPIFQGTKLVFMRVQPLGLQPATSLCQNIFSYSSQLPESSSTSPDNLNLHVTSLMTTFSSQKVSPLLFIRPKQFIQVTS